MEQRLRNHMPGRTTLLRLALVLLSATVAYALSLSQPVRAWYSDTDKLTHTVAFAGVYVGLVWALRSWPWWMVALLAVGLYAAVEVHQMFLPGFTPSVGDWGADAVGVALAAGAHWGSMKWKGAGGADPTFAGMTRVKV